MDKKKSRWGNKTEPGINSNKTCIEIKRRRALTTDAASAAAVAARAIETDFGNWCLHSEGSMKINE